ncbi:hypothetical protein CXF35_04180 [Corynebacterium bovis]|uniref:Uncharacterized protein n=1 Tax=Corynebacterium bovis TaxID=36808 RepID=A0A3R8QGU5_9CORY|nr:hypothetical protein CXF40_05970 [Corynebacterium bovis]RRO95260.1 hypothetical protein CXF32_07815 [Corynebacterium bovis]RRO98496.1 hypothetical protein CXF31_04405 [Corynebacterium bovis]RRO99338.1 hypothetical protein CXF41_09920 [Corynebacterium bovis]RRQ02714.1 hypothetical protein CXF39_05850 [Corynebacterium bovis]
MPDPRQRPSAIQAPAPATQTRVQTVVTVGERPTPTASPRIVCSPRYQGNRQRMNVTGRTTTATGRVGTLHRRARTTPQASAPVTRASTMCAGTTPMASPKAVTSAQAAASRATTTARSGTTPRAREAAS